MPRHLPPVRTLAVTAALSLCVLAGPVLAHKAHTHGAGKLTAAMEGERLEIALELPGADVIGFERQPATAEERAAVEKALATLHDAAAVLTLTADAQCVLESAEATFAGEQSAQHADFDVRYRYRCAAPAALKGADIRLFRMFPSLHRITAEIATGKGQGHRTLTAKKPDLRF